MNRQNIIRSISSTFPTEGHNVIKFLINQVLMAITLSSISGIGRICRIAAFSVMAGETLTNNFWAKDILWQLSVIAYNVPVMMRQKKKKFTKQEHRSFIEWFIAVPAKITRSGHQTELKMYEHHFYKADWEELDRLIEAA